MVPFDRLYEEKLEKLLQCWKQWWEYTKLMSKSAWIGQKQEEVWKVTNEAKVSEGYKEIMCSV